MPIPDVIMIEPIELLKRKELIKQRLQARRIRQVCNDLLRKQQECGKVCCSCVEKCRQLQAWIDLETEED